MAVTQIAFGRLINQTGTAVLGLVADSVVSEGIAPSGVNQQTTATAAELGVARVATDTAVYVAAGSNPNATNTETRQFLPANTVAWIGVAKGDKIAVAT